jgi:hypothetical protein
MNYITGMVGSREGKQVSQAITSPKVTEIGGLLDQQDAHIATLQNRIDLLTDKLMPILVSSGPDSLKDDQAWPSGSPVGARLMVNNCSLELMWRKLESIMDRLGV